MDQKVERRDAGYLEVRTSPLKSVDCDRSSFTEEALSTCSSLSCEMFSGKIQSRFKCEPIGFLP